MKVEFCQNTPDEEFIISFNVVRAPTEEDCEAIERYIENERKKYNIFTFDKYQACVEAAYKYLDIDYHETVKTFYV